ncbi:prolyl aminopeptidase [Paracoccus onubensis]|uniref:prolyl aminopeptidase n=1 Tax=Paracoccus onubensis TaxID=1675788 RepID=UPI0027314AB8|nr:prolyl aminopeptidase [Paracoccus onubensis]MDP0926063.1 prolyl aminopeptidase [Paracoccus onubensis]
MESTSSLPAGTDADSFSAHRLKVDDQHDLYLERHGTRGAIPTVFLHGGPGGGLNRAALRSFALARHDIVLFDQRGAGRSTPLAEIRGNTTADLVHDLERIRAHFGFERWMVAGGSWGSCLALAYAQAHPNRVSALRLHGIFLGGQAEIQWWFHGVRQVFPDHWERFANFVAAEERGDLLQAYYRRLMSTDTTVAQEAAWHLRNFSARTQTLCPDEAHVAQLLESPGKYLPVARLFTHYCINHAFMAEGALLAGIDRIRHIPAEILQGRYDMVTPMVSAWALHRAWPEARFETVTLANHTSSPAMLAAQRAASDRLADRIGSLADD